MIRTSLSLPDVFPNTRGDIVCRRNQFAGGKNGDFAGREYCIAAGAEIPVGFGFAGACNRFAGAAEFRRRRDCFAGAAEFRRRIDCFAGAAEFT